MSRNWPKCDVCGGVVSTEDGLLIVSTSAIKKCEAADAEWEKRRSKDQESLSRYSLEELMDFPFDRANWRWGHVNCVECNGYKIQARRFDTLGKALDWTLHLMQKSWFQYTDWEVIVGRIHKVPDA